LPFAITCTGILEPCQVTPAEADGLADPQTGGVDQPQQGGVATVGLGVDQPQHLGLGEDSLGQRGLDRG
jgi:hypothetical protein